MLLSLPPPPFSFVFLPPQVNQWLVLLAEADEEGSSSEGDDAWLAAVLANKMTDDFYNPRSLNVVMTLVGGAIQLNNSSLYSCTVMSHFSK